MKGSKIFKAAFIVMIISIISRFLGLFRDMLVSYQFGMNMYTDAYKAAVSVPETVFTIVGLGTCMKLIYEYRVFDLAKAKQI